jgi:5-formyltetrahydrofolate cyclo-ligase
MPDEPDIWPLVETVLADGKIVGLPRFSSQAQTYVAARVREIQPDICTGKYGIREPSEACSAIPWADIDLIVVPGIAFDLRGHRLGRGRGHYDRMLAQVRGIKCGVAFDEQIVSEIPAAEHDMHMNIVATPTRTIAVRDA